ncbi:hypothetical protein BZA05DRAFT_69119 [Tricharina praecox]|uniref:uncharacterized protein n=1 Tax=Tricharina praecox TaxID=43433 RepID=UPI00221F7196|nr:uncharacterized protein BZA05DRAFT_69119 [Tricharina praecox]KAI5850097.1 hypothetical protein BZA05DRAFT_69119 [Tricharina praecox]
MHMYDVASGWQCNASAAFLAGGLVLVAYAMRSITTPCYVTRRKFWRPSMIGSTDEQHRRTHQPSRRYDGGTLLYCRGLTRRSWLLLIESRNSETLEEYQTNTECLFQVSTSKISLAHWSGRRKKRYSLQVAGEESSGRFQKSPNCHTYRIMFISTSQQQTHR